MKNIYRGHHRGDRDRDHDRDHETVVKLFKKEAIPKKTDQPLHASINVQE